MRRRGGLSAGGTAGKLPAWLTPARTGPVYDRATAHLDAPLAVVDLEAFDANADDLVRRAGGQAGPGGEQVGALPRAAGTGAARGTGSPGVMSFTLAESLWLARAGFDDVLLAYPSADRAGFAELAADPQAGRRGHRDGGRRARSST